MTMNARFWLWAYGLLMRALQPLVLRKLRRRGVEEPLYLEAIDERWGHYRVPSGQGYLWVHAVSLGETRVAALLLPRLRARWPGLRLLLTHGTATGRELGRSLLQPGDVQVWQPWDTPDATRRFLTHFKPQMGLLIETEVWPHWVQACRQTHLPLVLANARLSEESHRKALRLPMLSRAAYAGLYAVWAQSPADAERLADLGAPVTAVLGNLKFDVQADAAQEALGQQARATLARPVVLLASSREGEEQAFLQALRAHPTARSLARWLIVPRHPQRFDEVARLAESAGWSVQRRSHWASPAQGMADWNTASNETLVVGDSVGEMGLYFALAQATLMGGSFEPLGGQNLIEALAYGCPVVVGPHTFNFEQATREAIEAGVTRRVTGWAQGIEAVLAGLPASPAEAAQTVGRCREFVSRHAGTGQRMVALLEQLGLSAPASR